MTKNARRGRLWIALALSSLPACLVLGLAWVAWDETLDSAREDRLEVLGANLRRSLDERWARQAKKVRAVSESEPVGRLLLDIARGTQDPRSWINEASRWLSMRDLDVLSVLDPSGTILSSGHLPAKFGEKDLCLLQAARGAPNTPSLCRLQVLRDATIVEAWAVVSGISRKWEQAEVLLVGGQLIDQGLVSESARMSAAVIGLQEGAQAQSTRSSRLVPLILPAVPGSSAPLSLRLSLEEKLRPPLSWLGGLFAIAFVFSLLLAWWQSMWMGRVSAGVGANVKSAFERSGPSLY